MGDRYSGRSPNRRGPARDRAPPLRDLARDRDDHPNVEYFGAGESYRPGGQTGDGPYRPVRERDNDRWNPSDRPIRGDRDGRDDRRRDEIDSYIPPTSARAQRLRSRSPPPYRRRSRTPPAGPAASVASGPGPGTGPGPASGPGLGRGRTELFPERPGRSPPPSARRYSPPLPRSDRTRSPVRRRSRSPFGARGRSPDNKRPRDFSPDIRRSPKRERYDSPPRARYNDRPRSPPSRRPASPLRDSYRPRSRTPPPRRDDVRPNYTEDRWRRRSPSPRGSAATSRRSSPRPHLDRNSMTGSRQHSPMRDRPRYDGRDPYTSRPRSPLPPPRRDDFRERGRSRDDLDRDRDRENFVTPAPPTGPRGASYNRAPPSGPAHAQNSIGSPPPSGAAAASVSAHNRSSAFAPPSGPRASAVPPRDFVSPPGAIRGRTSLTYRAPGYRPPPPNQSSFESASPPPTTASTITSLAPPPSGPRAASYSSRGDFPSAGRGSLPSGQSRSSSTTYHSSNEFAFRPNMNSSSSTTYPRSQRFNTTSAASVPVGPSSVSTNFNNTSVTTSTASPLTPATPANFVKSQLNTLESIVPGGRHVPGSAQSTTGLSADQERKLKALEDDAERIRSDIADKQRGKREILNEWEVRERESNIAALRSELAENHSRTLGEDDTAMAGAAF